ncbi:MAG: hypothetical protein OEO84_11325 [Betaproteobacteria bacterium]|nr:hypothetical protein [Betaproteobacteria bacterium]
MASRGVRQMLTPLKPGESPAALLAAAAIFVLLPLVGVAWNLVHNPMAFPVAAVAYLAICALLAWNLLQRRSWARVALAAIVLLDLAQYHWSLEALRAAYAALPAATVTSLMFKLLAVIALVLMFVPASNRWLSRG